ncbi:MAG: radical SAM protein [Mobilitalea sp.]
MYLRGEELFVVDYENDTKMRMLYVPLRKYVGLYDGAFIEDLVQNHDLPKYNKFFTGLGARKYYDPNSKDTLPQLCIPLTNVCNLTCRYCYAHGGTKGGTMSMTMIDRIIEEYFKNLSTKKFTKGGILSVNFLGGCEATCAFELMKHSVARIRVMAEAIGLRAAFMMPTNGCYSGKLRQFVVDNFHSVSLSFDGPRHIQDRQRPTVGGKGSYEKTFGTAKALYGSKAKIAIHSVVTNYSINYLEEIVDFFCENFPGVLVSFEKMDEVPDLCNTDGLCPPSYKEFVDAMEKIKEYIKGKPIRISSSRIINFDKLSKKFCSSISNPNWIFTIDGRITACMRATHGEEGFFDYGRYDEEEDKFYFDEDKIKAIRKMNIDEFEECKECFCKYSCSGGCPYLRKTGSFECTNVKEAAVTELTRIINDSLAKKK